VIHAHISGFDAQATAWLRRRPLGPGLRRMLAVLAHSGDSLVVLPVLGFAWWLSGFSFAGMAARAVAAVLSAMALVALAKQVFRRPRPEGEWGAIYRSTDPHSFPSGHAARTMALAGVAIVSVAPFPALGLMAWSTAVGLARVSLGVHWFLDVVAGWALGACSGLIVSLLVG